ncbi:BACK domain-containing protein [Haematococcus lacustris]|uniref:BACK domain-containing protein n=1 Tax=Haematococcus lacustris TaxID=44745 RepID=A0A6A0A2J0_HAELA|nr:BACK domain-containing protein [Haematococcus lacustris]
MGVGPVEHLKTKVLSCADGGSQRAADFQPSIAVAHFIKSGSLPAGLTAHQLAQETFDSQAECGAARLVVRCMYEGGLPEEVKEPLTLAMLPAEQLVLVLQTLPGNGVMQSEHYGWQEHVRSLIVGWYGDAHAVITSAQLRTAFQQLPFAAVQMWASNDALTVDSENSVVELISLWMAGLEGWSCSQQQKQQLSCLVRVQHLSPAIYQSDPDGHDS